MKKDYHFITREQDQMSEIELIEEHWTSIWDSHIVDHQEINAYIRNHYAYAPLHSILTKIPEGGTVLDAGCGQGHWVLDLSRKGFDIHGVDISQKTIEDLQRRFPQEKFSVADIRNLDFDNEYFDLVFSWGVFEHFENGLADCINEAYRVIKPGGYLCISVPFHNKRHIWRDSRPIRRWDKLAYNPNIDYTKVVPRFYQWRLTKPELHYELAIRGFNVEYVKPTSHNQGAGRFMQLDLGIKNTNTLLFKAIREGLALLPTRTLMSHMLIASARK
jgi:SAM-dependent methyltransferase